MEKLPSSFKAWPLAEELEIPYLSLTHSVWPWQFTVYKVFLASYPILLSCVLDLLVTTLFLLSENKGIMKPDVAAIVLKSLNAPLLVRNEKK